MAKQGMTVEKPKRFHSLLAVSLLPAILLTLPGLSFPLPLQGPAIPDPDLSIMEPQVASKIQTYREVVLAAPESHQTWGALGMVLHAHGLEPEAAECYRRAIELEPNEFRWIYLLVHAIKDEDPQGALVLAERASQVAPDYAALYVLRGQILEENDHLELALEQYIKAAANDPQSAMAEFGMGRIYLSQRELEISLRHLLRARELGPDVGAIRSSLAQVYRRQGDKEAAMREAQAASELTGRIPIRDPIHFEMAREDVSSLAILAQATAAGEAGDFESAEALYRAILVIRPNDADQHARLADALARQNKRQEAKSEYLAALAINPSHAAALSGVGDLLSLEKQYDEAVQRYQQSLEIRPNNLSTLVNLGSLLALLGRPNEAVRLFETGLEIDPDHFGCHRQLGQILLLKRNFAEAIVHFRAALNSRPDLGELHLQLAIALRGNGDMEAATTQLEKAESLGASFPAEFLENADQHALLADSLSAQDSQRDAKLEYITALAIDPKHAGALHGLANKLAIEKNYEDAVILYKEALEARPDHLPSYRNLGSLLALQGKQEEASALFWKCLEIDPDHFGCNRQLGQLFLQRQSFAEAIVHFRTALKSRPELGVLHGQLAIALAAEADFEGAWTHVKEAERLGANLPPRFLEELRRLSPEPGNP